MFEFLKVAPITKVVEKADGTVEAYGLATAQVPDKMNEICDYDDTAPEYAAWANEFYTTTTRAGQDPSFGNIRIMHNVDLGPGGKCIAPPELYPDKKEVWIHTVAANDDVGKSLKGGFLTAYSQGGKYKWRRCENCKTAIPDPPPSMYCPNCATDVPVRYAAKISEVSYVDNPCLASATFTFVRMDNNGHEVSELRKFVPGQIAKHIKEKSMPAEEMTTLNGVDRKWGEPQKDFIERAMKALPKPPVVVISLVKRGDDGDFTYYDQSGTELKVSDNVARFIKEAKTKRVAGEDLTAADHIIVGDKDDPSTWKLPWHFSTEAKTKRHLRNALARFSSLKGVSAEDKKAAWTKLKRLCEEHDIEVSDESTKAARVEMAKAITGMFNLDQRVEKGMYQLSSFAQVLQDVQYLMASQLMEGEWEGGDEEDFALAEELRAWLEQGVSIFRAVVEHETDELTATKTAAALLAKGDTTMDDLEKGMSMKAHFKKAAAHHEKAAGMHKALAEQHEKAEESHKAMGEHCSGAAKASSDGEDGGSMKAMKAHHSEMGKVHKSMAGHHTALHKSHSAMCEHCNKMAEHHEETEKAEAAAKAAAAALTPEQKAAAEKVAADAKAAADKALADAELAKKNADAAAAAAGAPGTLTLTDITKALESNNAALEAKLGDIVQKRIDETLEKTLEPLVTKGPGTLKLVPKPGQDTNPLPATGTEDTGL